MPIQTIFAERLKAARAKAGLSQKQLGIKAGIDEFAASARMNQYERGKHLPDLDTAKRLADALEVPMAYLYCPEDELAELLLVMGQVGPDRVRKFLRGL
jgi:transcriptional regulator with XRE-family HTH domain